MEPQVHGIHLRILRLSNNLKLNKHLIKTINRMMLQALLSIYILFIR